MRWGIATPACGLVRDDWSYFLQFPTNLQIPTFSLLNIKYYLIFFALRGLFPYVIMYLTK